MTDSFFVSSSSSSSSFGGGVGLGGGGGWGVVYTTLNNLSYRENDK